MYTKADEGKSAMMWRYLTSDFAIAIYTAFVLNAFSLNAASAQSEQQTQPSFVVTTEEVTVAAASAPLAFNSQVEAIEAVDVQARVSGFLKAVLFEEGQAVEVGDLLFEIEPHQMQAAATSAAAQLSRAIASRDAAQQTLTRTRTLASRNTTSQAALDEAQAAFDMANADVQNAEAIYGNAQLNLSYTMIHAPIAGTIGRSLATKGNLVGPSSGSLARIVQLDPTRVVFSVPDRLLVGIRQKQAGGKAVNPNEFKLTLTLANGTEYGERGTIQFVDNEVDPQTGTVAVRARFSNPDHILMPGQFVTLKLLDEAVGDLPFVPMSAVSQDRQGKFVYVLNPDDTVSRRDVEIGVRIDNKWAVTNGLNGGETIVIEGIQRIEDGQHVIPRRSGNEE